MVLVWYGLFTEVLLQLAGPEGLLSHSSGRELCLDCKENQGIVPGFPGAAGNCAWIPRTIRELCLDSQVIVLGSLCRF